MKNRAYLRSINIHLDVGHPERVAHFRPTSKSVRLVRALVGDDQGPPAFVIAPYGSGKSITAAYAGELVENRASASDVLSTVERRVHSIDRQLHYLIQRRRTAGVRGLYVPMYGHTVSVPRTLKDRILDAMRRIKLGREARTIERLPADRSEDLAGLLAAVTEKLASAGLDRLVIVWDEFGRHLQGLVSEGRPEELDVLQVLAEVTSRPVHVPVSLALLLHRSLTGYTAGLPAGVRREWAKIEGRFEVVQYLDDSREIYELIASIVEESREVRPPAHDFVEHAARAQRAGFFAGLEPDALARLLEAAYPLEPATLYLLPRVAARVAQNERTLFSFLHAQELQGTVRPSALYDYFRGEFQADSGAGGTQRAWLETESALHKSEADSSDREALKTAFLLGLGLSGERAHATYEQLSFALRGVATAGAPADIIDRLIDRKLLVHRRHSNQVVVWHGTDVDLRGRLEDEKHRAAADFHLPSFLGREAVPPVWRPVEYNARTGVRRYLEAEYVTVEGFKRFLAELVLQNGLRPGTDGKILYVLPRSDEEVREARTVASEIREPRLFVAVALETSILTDAALELACLLHMHGDSELISRDPLVKSELDHLTDDTRKALWPLVDRVLVPQPGGAEWFHAGSAFRPESSVELRRVLSDVMDQVFPLTPAIDSEMIVRRSPTPVVINARKKVELGLLERYGQEDLGIEGNFADKAVFRAVFLRTGLYRKGNGRWRLAAVDELPDAGMDAVWARLREFFTTPGTEKKFTTLIDELLEPPFGVREGLIPLFLAAALKAFPSTSALRRGGQFVEDVLPSVIEDLAKDPAEFELDVVALADAEKKFVTRLSQTFGPRAVEAEVADPLRAVMEAIQEWYQTLPPAAGVSRHLSSEAKQFYVEIAGADPVRFLLRRLPRIAGVDVDNTAELSARIEALKGELESLTKTFEGKAIAALGTTLSAKGIANGNGVREQASSWASNFPGSFSRKLPDQVAKALLGRFRGKYDSDAALVNALSSLLIGRSISQWDDSAQVAFQRQLRSVLDTIEITALELGQTEGAPPELRQSLARLATTRLDSAVQQLCTFMSPGDAAAYLDRLAEVLRKEPK